MISQICNFLSGGGAVSKKQLKEQREQTRKIEGLLKEFEELKQELFKGELFVVLPEGPKTDRYSQLLAYFHPQFRWKEWKNPMKEAV